MHSLPDPADRQSGSPDRDLRDAWLAEMWRPVPEWRQTRDERLDAERRNRVYTDHGDEPAEVSQ
jgi:hypothetical protein